MSPQITITPAIIAAMPGAGKGSPSRIAASIARHRRRAKAAVTTPAMISRTPTVSHAQWSDCPARSRAAATPEATSASAVRSHARYVRSFASWNCGSGLRSLMSPTPALSRCREPSACHPTDFATRIGLNLSWRDTRLRLQRSPTLLRRVEDGVWADPLEKARSPTTVEHIRCPRPIWWDQRRMTSSHRFQEVTLPKGNLNRSTQPVSVCT
jgi:hypothetical protein